MPMSSFLSDFPFNGERNYVHGPTLFEIFRNSVIAEVKGNEHTPIQVAAFRVNQLIQENGRIAIRDTSVEPLPHTSSYPMSEMLCNAAGRSLKIGLYKEDTSPIAHRRPSLEKSYIGSIELGPSFCGTAELQDISDNGRLFQAVVEANKQIHLATIAGDPYSTDIKFRFAYCLNYTCPPQNECSGKGVVSVKSMGTQDTADNFFSLTKLTLTLGAFSSSFRLCFASRDIIGYKP